jgi:hypothetical protein
MITTRRVNILSHRMMSDYNISRGVCMSWYRDETESAMGIISHSILVRSIRYFRTRGKRCRKFCGYYTYPYRFSYIANNSEEVSYVRNT